jgi:hypothetical protein
MAIPKPGGTHRDWLAMIAYLVTERDVSRRAVTDQDLRQLKKWAPCCQSRCCAAPCCPSWLERVCGWRLSSASRQRVPDCSVRQEEGENRSRRGSDF